MTAIESFRDVIDLWATKGALERDMLKHGGEKKKPNVRDWWKRDRIPEPWFDAVLAAAQARGFEEVTYRVLSQLYKRIT